MKIKNKRRFALGCCFMALSLACFLLAGLNYGLRFLVGGTLALLLSLFYLSGTPDADWEQALQSNADERDRFLAMKSCQSALQWGTYLLYAGILVTFALFAAFRAPAVMAVGCTLTAVLLIYFLLLLTANFYWERRG